MQQNKIPSAYFREQKKYYTFESKSLENELFYISQAIGNILKLQ